MAYIPTSSSRFTAICRNTLQGEYHIGKYRYSPIDIGAAGLFALTPDGAIER